MPNLKAPEGRTCYIPQNVVELFLSPWFFCFRIFHVNMVPLFFSEKYLTEDQESYINIIHISLSMKPRLIKRKKDQYSRYCED